MLLKYKKYIKFNCYCYNFAWRNFSELFNNETQSDMYKSRPEYNIQIVEKIISFWTKWNKVNVNKSLTIVDVGCGTGQLTNLLTPYAKNIIGIDSSNTQIKEAKSNLKDDVPKYMVGSCYDIPVSDASVDLITAAQCVHWFDIEKFYTEIDRCLCQRGVLAVLTYGKGRFIIDRSEKKVNELNQFVTRDLWLSDEYLGTYVGNKPKWAWNFLPGLKFLYPETGLRDESSAIEFKLTLKRYGNYLRSTSMYQAWKKNNQDKRDFIEVSLERILTYLGNPKSGLDTEVQINFPVCMIMCSKP